MLSQLNVGVRQQLIMTRCQSISALSASGSVLLAGLSLACAGKPFSSPGPCVAPAVDMRGWVERGGRAFSLQLPPAFIVQPARGLDSEVGRWSAGTTWIGYDYGSYAWDLTDSDTWRERHVCDVEIGGRRARLVLARTRDRQYFAAAHWPGLRASSLGTVSLTVGGNAADATGQRTLLASLWSVRIRD